MKLVREKFTFVALVVLVFVAFSGCSLNEKIAEKGTKAEKISIVASVFPIYDLTRQIVKDKASVYMLLPPGTDVHEFEPSAKDISGVLNSDVFLYAGFRCEPWVHKNFSEVVRNKDNVFDISSKVNFIKTGNIDDPHIWLDLENVETVLVCILDVLCNKDPENADFYRKNAEAYSKDLRNLDEKFRETVDSAKVKKLLFASRFAGNYFANRYKLQYIAACTSCDDNSEPNAKKVAEIMNCIKNEKVPVVFYEYGSSTKLAETVSAETGVKILVFNSMHTIDKSSFNSGTTYLDLMNENLKNLKQGLA